MDKVIIVLIIIQLITTAFGIAVIESVRPLVEKKLHDRGYVLKRRNSLYYFNDELVNVAKGFIPYFAKALSIINNKEIVDKKVEEEIRNGNYVERNVEIKKPEESLFDLAHNPELSVPPKRELLFEKPEKYTARKNDISLYDTYETPVEYITRESEIVDDLELTPFNNNKEEIQNVVVKEDVNKSDIAKAISELDVYELELLKDKIGSLVDIKKDDVLMKIKDVA